MFGASGLERTGAGHAGSDSLTVRPMRPVKVVPGLYSFRLIWIPSLLKDVPITRQCSRCRKARDGTTERSKRDGRRALW